MPDITTQERQVRRLVVNHGSISSEELRSITGMSPNEFSLVARSLIKRRELYVSGKAPDKIGRLTVYIYAPTDAYLRKLADQRKYNARYNMNVGQRNQAEQQNQGGMRNAYGDARPWEITKAAAAPKAEPWYRRVAKRIFGGSRPQASA